MITSTFIKQSRLFGNINRKFYYTVTKDGLKNKNEALQKDFAKQLRMKIKQTGPITVAEYMKEVLTNPLAGYYMHQDVFGKSGDFITSPELGQLFGEMVAVWFLNEWRKIGSPKPLQLVELGPGRGSLCQDIMKVFKHFNELTEVSLHLVEVSPFLADVQSRKLCLNSETLESDPSLCYRKGVTSMGVSVSWYQNLLNVPRGFSLVLAHEFFDALPIHKFQKDQNCWREILIDIGTNNEELRYVLSGSETLVSKLFISKNEIRNHIEISLDSVTIMEEIAKRIEEDGGIFLVADYGHDGERTDTFRAFKNHKLQNPLAEPGSADLTADVDFRLLKTIATRDNRTIAFGPVSQKHFLTSLGITERLKQLLKHATQDQENALNFAYNMMTDSDQMGTRFKLLSLFPAILNNHLQKFPVAGFT